MIYTRRTYFECIIPERNRRAFYEIIAGKDLFGFIVFRRWGRLGTKGQPRMQQRFANEKEMLAEYERVCNERLKHGYNALQEHTGAWLMKSSKRVFPWTQTNSNYIHREKQREGPALDNYCHFEPYLP